MTPVIDMEIRNALPMEGNSWLVHSRVKERRQPIRTAVLVDKKWVPQPVQRRPLVILERYSIIKPEGVITHVHTSENAYLSFNTKNKGWIVRDIDSDRVHRVVWEEKPAKHRRMIDFEDMRIPNFQRHEDWLALVYRDARYLLGSASGEYEYDCYSYRQVHFHELIPKKVIEAVVGHMKERSGKKLLMIDLASGSSKTFDCPFPIKNACFSDDGQTLLVYGKKQFFIIDQPI